MEFPEQLVVWVLGHARTLGVPFLAFSLQIFLEFRQSVTEAYLVGILFNRLFEFGHFIFE